MEKNLTVELTPNEFQALMQLFDAGVRHTGAQGVHAASAVLTKLEAAAQAAQKPPAGTEPGA